MSRTLDLNFLFEKSRPGKKQTNNYLGGARLGLDSFLFFFARVLIPPLPVLAGTWVTFGGQITDEVRTDGFCHFPSVKVQEWETST